MSTLGKPKIVKNQPVSLSESLIRSVPQDERMKTIVVLALALQLSAAALAQTASPATPLATPQIMCAAVNST
jgi:hypothetical protein